MLQSLIGQPGMPGATHGIDAKRRFDREVIVRVIADLMDMIKDQDEKLKVQAENIRSVELKLACAVS
jgi:hypothetical protein